MTKLVGFSGLTIRPQLVKKKGHRQPINFCLFFNPAKDKKSYKRY